MNIHTQVVLLHVGHVVGTSRLKAIIRPHTIDVVPIGGAWQPVNGKGNTLRQPPLSRGHRFVYRVVAQCLQVVGQVAAVVPLAEELCIDRVRPCHIRVGHIRRPRCSA